MHQARIAMCVAAVCLLASTLLAQSDSSQITGFVKDPSGLAVPNAAVTITDEATKLERKVQTNESGYYVATNMRPGFYTVSAEATGFKKFVKSANKLDASLPLTVDVTLDVGAVTETVEVVASTATVQADTATVGRLVERSQIENMMLNGRNPMWLAQLKAGVRSGQSLARFNYDLNNDLQINGGRTQDFAMSFDGAVAIRTRANGTSIGVADVDTVQEIQVLTANYNAEYGRSGSGQVRIVTRSGTRDFHGSLYEYFRNNVLDANSWERNRSTNPVQNEKPPARRFNQFGYIVDGPVYIPKVWNTDRNKLFFLWSQEWVRFREEATETSTVPTALMREGNFSELLGPNAFFSTPRIVNDPTTGQPLPGNVIPASLLSSNGLALLRTYPLPTPGFIQGTSNFIQTRPQPTNQRKDTISLDFNPVEKHSFRFRHQNYSWKRLDAFRGGLDRAVTDWNRPNKTASLNYIWTVSPTMVNEFLTSASVDRVFIGVQREGGRFERSKYGISYPYVFPERKEIFDKIPTVALGTPFRELDGGPYPAFSSGPIYVISNNFTKVFSNHTFKIGALFERSGQNDFDQINVTGVPGGTNNQNGRFSFTDNRGQGIPSTGLAIANAAAGLFSTYAEIGQRAFTIYRSNMFEWFVQDSWKVTPKLRLELGLRHTYVTPYYWAEWGNIAAFDPNRYNPANAVVQDPRTGFIISGDRYNGVVIPGNGPPEKAAGRIALFSDPSFNRLFTGDDDRFFGERQWLNFQPRVGVAYAFSPRNAIRAGFGRFMNRPGVSDNIFLGGNPPLQPMVSIANGQVDNPSGGNPSTFPLFFMTTDPKFKIPSAYQWNVTYEREFIANTIITAGYVGRVGLHLERERNINALQPGTIQANPGIEPSVLRPYKGYQVIALGENAARSEYNALQLEVNRRFSQGLSFGFSYTLSESKDNASERRNRIFNPFDDRIMWGYSNFDARHIAVVNFMYELPFFRNSTGAVRTALGGWQVTGITQFQSGTPFTVGRGEDYAGIGSGNELQPWEKLGSPDYTRKFSNADASGRYVDDPNFWFTMDGAAPRNGFSAPAPGTFSKTQNRNQFFNPGIQNWNLAVFKDFQFTERQRLQFRSEFFNWLNHPNWDNVSASVSSNNVADPTSASFGKVIRKTSERNIQLSLRYNF